MTQATIGHREVRGPFGRRFVVNETTAAVNIAQSIWHASDDGENLPGSWFDVQQRWAEIRPTVPNVSADRYLSINEFWAKYVDVIDDGIAQRVLHLVRAYKAETLDLFDPDQCDDGER